MARLMFVPLRERDWLPTVTESAATEDDGATRPTVATTAPASIPRESFRLSRIEKSRGVGDWSVP